MVHALYSQTDRMNIRCNEGCWRVQPPSFISAGASAAFVHPSLDCEYLRREMAGARSIVSANDAARLNVEANKHHSKT